MSFRRVKPLFDDDGDQDEIISDPTWSGAGNEEEAILGGASEDGGRPESEGESEGMGSGDEGQPNAQDAISQISFGTLARAQKSIFKDHQKAQSLLKEERIVVAKAQLAALKGSKDGKFEKPRKTREELKRSSKHAPQEISSKRAVTRRREVIAPILPAIQVARDPRFDTAIQGVYDEKSFKKNYSFLDDYRKDEMNALKQEISKCRDEQKKEQLKKQLTSMESKRKAGKDKEQAENIVQEHKKKERELIKQGKKPFYLKKTEQKKLLLMEKYSKLNEKQLEKVMEKKRKRKSQKERKSVPFERRAG